MKKIYPQILLFLTLISPPLNAQVESDNLWGIDFHVFGTSVHYAGRIGDEFFLGGEAGLLPDQFDWVLLAGEYISKENTIWSSDKSQARVNDIDQLIYLHFFTRWKPDARWFEVDGGLRWAVFSRSGYDVDDLGLTRFLGVYLKPMVGLDRIKAGVQFDFGDMSGDYFGPEHEFVIIASPFIRYNFR